MSHFLEGRGEPVFGRNSHGRVYLDYNATTPVDPAVLEAMLPFLADNFGNAGSVDSAGQRARAACGRRARVPLPR